MTQSKGENSVARPPSSPHSQARSDMQSTPNILHLHSTFSAGGKELRCVQLINAFGASAQHAIVSAMPENMQAASLIASGKGGVKMRYPRDFPPLQGRTGLGRLRKIAEAMKPYDLILTYNWGAMDAVMAHTLFSQWMKLPPLIHHEDGFNEDERHRLKKRRNWFRRIALGRSAGLVVPSEVLEEIALSVWHQPMGRVKQIANGIDTRAFARKPKPDALPSVVKRADERWVGTLAGLRKVKNLPRLVRAFAALPPEWQLVIVGEGPEEAAIRAEAEAVGVGHRLHMPGFAADPARFVGLFDIFALSSDTEQFPISVIEAMAASRPVVSTAVGDVVNMVSEGNRRFIVPVDEETARGSGGADGADRADGADGADGAGQTGGADGADAAVPGGALGQSLLALAQDDGLRMKLGEANRQKALSEFDEKQMVDIYSRLYGTAMGLPRLI